MVEHVYTDGSCHSNSKGGIKVVELNEEAKEYMQRFGWKHVVLNIESITS